jgi:hypothetical protein
VRGSCSRSSIGGASKLGEVGQLLRIVVVTTLTIEAILVLALVPGS